MSSPFSRWMTPETRSRRLLMALGIYGLCIVVFAIAAGPHRLLEHGSFNHYAHLADAWLHGRQDLRNGAPAYAMNNDFAEFQGKTYISFPPFPAVLMLPFVALAGSPEDFVDGQFIVWLAGLGPALLFLVLEKLRRTGRSPRTETENAGFGILLAFGTVYFFSAVNGGVWFAAHVVAMAMMGGYVLFALDAENPALAGLFLAGAWMTRPPMLLTGLLFALEAARMSAKAKEDDAGTVWERLRDVARTVDWRAFAHRAAPFAAPLALSFAVASWMNYSRFGLISPFAFGHEFLGVVWRDRIAKWGLFNLHFLPKNLGVALTILPWMPPKSTFCFEGPQPAHLTRVAFDFMHCVPFRINEHGLAAWFTMPFYFWLLRPKKISVLLVFVLATAALPMAQDLLYQNSGWRQFGYRFSNDYSFLLLVALAVGARPLGRAFQTACAWAIVWNTFGALSFDKSAFDRFYFREGSQTVLYQPD